MWRRNTFVSSFLACTLAAALMFLLPAPLMARDIEIPSTGNSQAIFFTHEGPDELVEETSSLRTISVSDKGRPTAVFILGKIHTHRADYSSITNSGWMIWDFSVSDPEALLASVTISGPKFGDNFPLKYFPGASSFWEPDYWPSLGQTTEELQTLTDDGVLRFTVSFNSKTGDSWTQEFTYDLSKFSDNDISAAFNALSVKRSGSELCSDARNLVQQVLSPASDDNKFTVQWNGTSVWKPDRARGRIFLYEYFSPARRGRYQKNWPFTGNPVTVDFDALETTGGQPINWREQFVNYGRVEVVYAHPELPNTVLVSRINLLPDVGLEPEAIINKVFPRKDSISFSTETSTKTARIKALPYRTPDPSWETAEIRFFLDGSPMVHRNHESAVPGARYCLAGWTENPSLSGEHELSVELTYRNGIQRTVKKMINFSRNDVRFPLQTFYILSDSFEIFPLKPDVPKNQTLVTPHDDYSTEVIVASRGVEGITDNETFYRSNFYELQRRDPSGGYSSSGSLDGMTGVPQTNWKKTYAAYRYTYSGSIVYDVRYELRSTNSGPTEITPRSSLLYQRIISAKGEVTYRIGFREIYFTLIAQNLIKSISISGPGYDDGGEEFIFWDGGPTLDVVNCPSWEEKEFWGTVASDNTLRYTLKVTRSDGTISTIPYSIDLSDLRNNISELKTAFQKISVIRQGREISKGDTARAGEYLHVLSPDNSLNQFLVSYPINTLPLERVSFRLSADGSFSHSVSQRLEKHFSLDETGRVTVTPSVLYLRGRSGLDPQDWRTWFLKQGHLRTIQDSLRYQPVNGGTTYSPVYLENYLEILPDIMLDSSVSYRTIFRPNDTETGFTTRKDLQFYMACTSLPQGKGEEKPTLSGLFAGQTLEPGPSFSSGRGSLSNEETNSKMQAFFADPAALDGTREVTVTATYPSGATRTMRRGFELKQNSLREPVNAKLYFRVGSGPYTLVSAPRLWTGAESFRWTWGMPKVDDVSTTFVQVSGLKNSISKGYGYNSFDGAGPLSAEITGLPADLYTVNPMFAHKYLGDAGYQISYQLLPFSKLNVSISGPTGARWSLDGAGSYTSGQTVNNVLPGSHTVSFSGIPGWTSPADISVSLEPGQSLSLTGEYSLSAAMPGGWKAIEAGDSVRLEWDPVQGFDGPVEYRVNILDEHGNVIKTYTVTEPFINLKLEAYSRYSIRVDVVYGGKVFTGQNWNFTPVSTSRGAWIMGEDTNIYKYRKTETGDEWTWTPGQAKYLTAVTEETCWMSETSSNTLYKFSKGIWEWTPAKSKWVSAYTQNDLWLVEANTDTLFNYKDGVWIWTPAKTKVISAPNDKVLWLVEKNSGYVFKHTPSTGTWEWTPGTALSLSAATEDVVWVIALTGDWLFRYNHRTGEWKWHNIRAKAVSAVSESEAWFVDMNGKLCIFKDGEITVVGGACADVSAYPSPAISSAAKAEALLSGDGSGEGSYDGQGTGCSASSQSLAGLLFTIPLILIALKNKFIPK